MPEEDMSVPPGYANGLFDLKGRVAVVTGGGSGLGAAMAIGFAQVGVTVVVADINEAGAEATRATIAEQGGKAVAVRLDVTDREQCQRPRRHASSATTAGSTSSSTAPARPTARPAEEFPEDKFDFIIALNLKGTYLCCQAFGRQMLDAEARAASSTSPRSARSSPIRWASAYLASKGGVLQMTRGLALEWRDRGVRVNGIGPTLMEFAARPRRGEDDLDHRRFHQGADAAPAARPAARTHRRRDLSGQRRLRTRHRPCRHVRRRLPGGVEGTNRWRQITKAHHTGFTVRSLERSLAFYRDLLGFEVVFQWNPQAPYIGETRRLSGCRPPFGDPAHPELRRVSRAA